MIGKIGIFDSGIGGVTVFKEILKILPKEDYIYYSDSANNPYGDKKESELRQICVQIVDKLIEDNCKIIVIACNTASARTGEYLRKKYKNIPIIAIEPAYKMIHDYAKNEETLLLATKATIESEKFKNLYKKYNNNKTTILPSIGLADLIENNNIDEIKKYLDDNIKKYKGKVKNVVLGCTHYPLIEDEIKEILGKDIVIFNGAKNLAKHLKDILIEKEMLEYNTGNIIFLDSSDIEIKEKRFFDILDKEKILI